MPHQIKHGFSPAGPATGHDHQLELKVIFTDLPKTAAALDAARSMASGLGARITLLAARVVPYPLPLTEPDVPVEFTERVLESAVTDATVEIYLCRDRKETIRRALSPDSVVIIGSRRRHWWPSWDRQLAKILRRDGLRVLVVPV